MRRDILYILHHIFMTCSLSNALKRKIRQNYKDSLRTAREHTVAPLQRPASCVFEELIAVLCHDNVTITLYGKTQDFDIKAQLRYVSTVLPRFKHRDNFTFVFFHVTRNCASASP